MEKLKLHTPDFTQENITRLAALFPSCVTEVVDEAGKLTRAIDFDRLRQELSPFIVEGPRERFQLSWPGKRAALLAANAPIAKTLRPRRDESVDFDTTRNIFIEGDNLDALKLLQETYLSRIKFMYIDPPYNTGNDFIYDDDFSQDTEAYLRHSNQSDESGSRMVSNTETKGRFHSHWLSMMYSRLRLARNLLDTDGVICVSISDIELGHIRSVLNEVFGEDNYVNTISVLAKVAAGASGGGEDKRLKKNIEFILIYAKRLAKFNTLVHLYTQRPLLEVIEEMRAEGGSWKYTSILVDANPREHLRTIKDGAGNPIEIYRRRGVTRTTISRVCRDENIDEERAYRKYFRKVFSDTNAQTSIRRRVGEVVGNLDDNEILEVQYVPRSGRNKGQRVTHTYIGNTVRRVIWLSEVAEESHGYISKKQKLGTLWDHFDYNNVGKEGEVPFPEGKKPIDLIRTCLQLYARRDGICMDFFAGSCSLAHAVMRENVQDRGTRRFIVVQLPEPINVRDKKYETALRYYAENDIPPNVAEIGKERIRRAGKKLKEAHATIAPQLDIGFRVLKVDTSNTKDVYYSPGAFQQGDLPDQVDIIKEDREDEDLLFQVLLEWGIDLSLPIVKESLQGKTVFFVDENALAACFESGINEALVENLAARKPRRAVFRDAGYSSDSTKINVRHIFRLVSPGTEVKSL